MITTDRTGRAWLFDGTDSGFESRSAVYYTRFTAFFEPMCGSEPGRGVARLRREE